MVNSRKERGKPDKYDSFNYWTIPFISVVAVAAGVMYGGKKVYDFYKSRKVKSNSPQPNGLENNTKKDDIKDGLSSKL